MKSNGSNTSHGLLFWLYGASISFSYVVGGKMKSEADFKKHFKASVKSHGGFSISLAAPMLPGIPDLYVVLPGYAPVLLEAKWLKDVPELFERTIKYTDMQKNFIAHCNKVLVGSAWGLVGGKIGKKIFASMHDTKNKFASWYIIGDGCSTINTQKEVFDVPAMFDGLVPKMNLTYTPVCATMPVETKMGETQDDATTQPLAV